MSMSKHGGSGNENLHMFPNEDFYDWFAHKQIVSFEELLMSQVVQQEVLMRMVIEK